MVNSVYREANTIHNSLNQSMDLARSILCTQVSCDQLSLCITPNLKTGILLYLDEHSYVKHRVFKSIQINQLSQLANLSPDVFRNYKTG